MWRGLASERLKCLIFLTAMSLCSVWEGYHEVYLTVNIYIIDCKQDNFWFKGYWMLEEQPHRGIYLNKILNKYQLISDSTMKLFVALNYAFSW